MNVSSVTSTIVQLLLILLIPLIVVAVFVYMVFFNVGPSEQLQLEVIAAQFERHQAAAEVYYGRLLDYDGMCADIGLPSEVQCQTTLTEYRMSQKLKNGIFYCIDSTGFAGLMNRQPSGLQCR